MHTNQVSLALTAEGFRKARAELVKVEVDKIVSYLQANQVEKTTKRLRADLALTLDTRILAQELARRRELVRTADWRAGHGHIKWAHECWYDESQLSLPTAEA